MRKYYFLLTLLLFFTITSSVIAQTTVAGSSVILPKDKVVNEMYFASGESVTISGTVNGDAYIAGGTLYVDGVINGDLLFAGGTANINGTVTGDIRGAGGQINIAGRVDGYVTVVGGNINVAQGAQIAKGIVGAGGQLNIIAPLGKGGVVAGGQVTLGNIINGNVVAATKSLILTPNAKILGNLNYYSEQKATIQQGATISGTLAYHQQEYKKYQPKIEKKVVQTEKKTQNVGLVVSMYNAVVLFILGALFIRLFPRFMEVASTQIESHPFSTMGLGMLFLMFLPIISFIFFITIIGIPISIFLFVAYGIYVYVAGIFVALFTGKKILGWFKTQKGLYIQLLVGAVTLFVLVNIPVLGWLIKFMIAITGIGAILMTKKSFYSAFKSKNLI